MVLERTVMPSCCDIACNKSRYSYMQQLPAATPTHGEHSLSPAARSALADMPAPASARAPMPPGLLGRQAAEELAGQHIGNPPGHPLGHAGQHSQHVAFRWCCA